MKRRIGGREGQTVLLYTFALATMFGAMGLVVDIGYAYYRKQVLQGAVDAAAVGAAMAAYQSAGGGAPACGVNNVVCYADDTPCSATVPTTPTNNIENGCMWANANGVATGPRIRMSFQSGVGTAPTAVGVNISYWVVARASERIPQLFSAVLGKTEQTITARASTGVRVATQGGCVFTMNPTAYGALSMNGSTTLTSGCGLFINSNSTGAINIVGGGTISTTGAARTYIVGNWQGSGTISPAPLTGQPVGSDPFEEMAAPSSASNSCTSTGVALGSHQELTINPTTHGVICNGIVLDAQSSLTLQPGLYVVRGGISLGGQTTISGSGVTIYVQTGGVSMAGGARASLTAPSSGTWQGILFYQARGNTSASTLVGGTTQQMNGVLYFPSAPLSYTGGSSTVATATTIVSDRLTLVGNSYIQAAATSQYTGISGGVFLVD